VIDLACGGFGDRNLLVRQRVRQQLERVALSSQLLPSRPFAELLERLASLAPGSLGTSILFNSAAEAIDAAVRLALARDPSRRRVVATRRAYHGSTLAGRALAAHDGPPTRFLDLEWAQVELGDAPAARHAIDRTTAAVVVEPFATAEGLVLPPPHYFDEVAARCRDAGAILICDEVVTGLGRTGAMLGVEHHGVVPDVVVLGDALGGGVVPIGACIASRRVFRRARRHAEPLLFGTTTSGSPLACAAALAALATIEEEDLCRRARRVETIVAAALVSWQRRHPSYVVDAAAKGLMAGARFPSRAAAARARDGARTRGCLVAGSGEWLSVRPPLTVTEDEVRDALTRIGDALAEGGETL
jgi:putrescine aminotransferase